MPTKTRNKFFTTSNLKKDGFSMVCTIDDYSLKSGDQWDYVDVDERFVGHAGQDCSYIYSLCIGPQVSKIGETANPMLIEKTCNFEEGRWLKGTKSRLGRYMNGDGTCESIRDWCSDNIRNVIKDQPVTFWAKPLPITKQTVVVLGEERTVSVTMHKDMELIYLDTIKRETGSYPMLNKNRK